MKTLIVIDMQNDFIDGTLGTPEAQAIVPNVKRKIDEFMASNNPVIFTRDTHPKNYLETQEGKLLPVEHCICGSEGWKISEVVADLNTQAKAFDVIDKDTFGYHSWGMYEKDFEGCDEIVLVGLCTDICVVSNALCIKAVYPEIKITVDASCCAGVTPETHKAALTTMKMCQINVIGE